MKLTEENILKWLDEDPLQNWFGFGDGTVVISAGLVLVFGFKHGYSRDEKVISIFEKLVEERKVCLKRFQHLGNKAMYFSLKRT